MKIINLIWRKVDLYLSRTPLAWHQLSYQKGRLLLAVAGIAISVLLIFTQLGIRASLFKGITLLPESFNGDLYVLSGNAQNLESSLFPDSYLYEISSIEGVKNIAPLYIGFGNWVDPDSRQLPRHQRQSSVLQILAINPVEPVFLDPEINQQLQKLIAPGGVLFDRLSRSQLGSVAEKFAEAGYVDSIIDNRRVRVVGLFSMGATYLKSGRVIISDWNLTQRQLGINQAKENNKLNYLSLGIISLQAGTDKIKKTEEIKNRFGNAIKVLTKKELLQLEQDCVASLPSGKLLNLGAAIAFFVGLIMVYQIIFTDIHENLPEYSTLKAMGYSDRALSLVVIEESLLLALMGFIPGYLGSHGIYYLLSKFVELQAEMHAETTLQVFLMNLVMCLIAGLIATKKLRNADPADIYSS